MAATGAGALGLAATGTSFADGLGALAVVGSAKRLRPVVDPF